MKHALQKLGLGVGLMAGSASAFAGGAYMNVHTFGDAMLFARSAAAPVYATFLPSGNQSTDYVILLELTQGTGTAPGTWQYFLSSSTLGANAGAVYLASAATGAAAQQMSSWNVSAGSSISATSASFSSSWYGPKGNAAGASISVPFSFSSGVSSASATCNITFNANVGTNDYMQYQIAAFTPLSGTADINVGFTNATNVLSNSYTFTTKSGGATSDTVTGTYAAGNLDYALANATALAGAAGPVTGTSFPVPAWTYVSATITGASTNTFSVGSAAFKQLAACSGMANSRLALNSNGFTVTGQTGMLRLW